jgi:hypothetical protein
MNIRYKVLCIGVNRVPGLKRLNYAEKDAQTTAKYFKTLKDKVDVTLLTGEKTTRANILNWVKECSRIQGKLTVIIFFAGHGSAEKDENEKKLERCLWINSNPDTGPGSHQLKTAEILNLLNNPLWIQKGSVYTNYFPTIQRIRANDCVKTICHHQCLGSKPGGP